jgi:hypothetical protein
MRYITYLLESEKVGHFDFTFMLDNILKPVWAMGEDRVRPCHKDVEYLLEWWGFDLTHVNDGINLWEVFMEELRNKP